VLSVDSRLGCAAVKSAILNNVDPDPALAGKTVTGGRLDVGNILPKMGGGASGAVVVNGLAGWFRFDDGGVTAEDFTLTADWRRDWRFAGQLSTGAVMTNTNPHVATGDSDGDGLPDWWEVANGLDPYDATGDNGADGDPDGDGLSNLYEYLAGTDPHNPDTGNTGISDYDKDSDGDGIPNGIEQDVYHTNPGNWLPGMDGRDTDDDGVSDGQEVLNSTKPTDSTSPYRLMVLEFKGTGANIVRVSDKVNEHYTSRHSMAEWTIEAYVQPYATQNDNVSYPLISRRTVAFGLRNYEIGLKNGVPYVASRWVRTAPTTNWRSS